MTKILNATSSVPKIEASHHYAASSTAKEFRSWQPQITSPDGELTDERDILVARNRDLTRNNGIASGLEQTYEDSIIGAQFRLSSRPDYRALGKTKEWAQEWSKDVEARWRMYATSVDCDAARLRNFHGLTKLVLNSGMGNGEALALVLWLKDRSTKTVFQLIDVDRLSNPNWRVNDATLRDGIEISKLGEHTAYHIQKHHPGDYFMGVNTYKWERVPARTRFGRRKVLHVFDQKRPGQSRAKPMLTSVMGKFRMLDQYEVHELKSTVTNAMVAAFIETSMSATDISEMFQADYKLYNEERAKWTAQLEGGSIIPLYPGDKLSAFDPSRPSTGFPVFVESMLRHIAAGANLPYELLAKDFSKVNYSSARAAILEAWRFFNGRRVWISDYWATPAYDLWMEEKINAGEIEAPGFYEFRSAYTKCKWLGGGRGWVDEQKEAKSAQMRIDYNLSTLEDEAAEQGKDWEENLEQRAVELRKMKELEEEYGITFYTENPAAAPVAEENDSGDEGGDADDPEDDEAEQEDEDEEQATDE